MLTHQRRRVISTRIQGRHCMRFAIITTASQSIPECDRNIPQPAFMPNAPYRATFEPLIEFILTPCEQLNKRRAFQPITRIKIR